MRFDRRVFTAGIAGLVIGCKPLGSTKPRIETLQSGLRFGTMDGIPNSPSPVLFHLASDVDTALTERGFNEVPQAMAGTGILCVTLDLPCHGKDHRPDEPFGLQGWRFRLDRGEDVFGPFVSQFRAVLDHLIESGRADPLRVATSGISRGGFCALKVASQDTRVKSVAGMSPVTDLMALHEFYGFRGGVPEIDATKLREASIWLSITRNDNRVGTQAAEIFAKRLASIQTTGDVSLHLFGASGHTVMPEARSAAATWLRNKLRAK